MNFSQKIIRWYDKNKRQLPWRITSDPYKIWLSEIILQQTRIDQGLDYYLKFVSTYPDILSLASANEEDILKLWQGLGYYSRARNLHKTARIITEKYNGVFPSDYKKVLALPGIGEYTAAAVLSISFNQVYPVVDGNVQRVITRIFGIKEIVDSPAGKKKIKKKTSELIIGNQPGIFNQAIMEFGALYCKPNKPNCSGCIFNKECKAFLTGKIELFPKKKSRIKQRIRHFHYLVFIFKGNDSVNILINKREKNDIWKNLYDFPLIESTKTLNVNSLKKTGFQDLDLKNLKFEAMGNEYKHILSHQVIKARFFKVDVEDNDQADILTHIRSRTLKLIDMQEVVHFPLPRLIDRFIHESDDFKFN